jgi:hypothetical protein
MWIHPSVWLSFRCATTINDTPPIDLRKKDVAVMHKARGSPLWVNAVWIWARLIGYRSFDQMRVVCFGTSFIASWSHGAVLPEDIDGEA